MMPDEQVDLLHGLIARAFLNPFSPEEWTEVHQELAHREAEVERLGAILAKERADVEWMQGPLVRVMLWLYGELAARDAKEQAEYEAARADVLAQGVPAQELRMWIERLRPEVVFRDDEVYAALDRLPERLLVGLPVDLLPLHARVQRHSVCRSAVERLQIDLVSTGSDAKLLPYIRADLLAVGEVRLADQAGAPNIGREQLMYQLQAVPFPEGLANHLRVLAKQALFERE